MPISSLPKKINIFGVFGNVRHVAGNVRLQFQNPREKRVYIYMIGAAVALRNVFLPEIKASCSETSVFLSFWLWTGYIG